MVARIITGKTMRGALSYNENKISEGKAVGILASNFGKEFSELSFHEKLNRFQNLIRWNRKTKTNTVHISLNFAPGEKLSTDQLSKIASFYMSQIGFGNQPFLVYEHHDAAHPHVHILSTNIRSDGKRIDLHNIGRTLSEKARVKIEKDFHLVNASERSQQPNEILSIRPVYGKAETRRSIVNAVTAVARNYRYTSLPEFNAALRQFSVIAHRGDEHSIMFRKGGLIFSMLSPASEMTGVPVKASSIHFKPTLKFLEKQFKLNKLQREIKRSAVIARIASVLKSNKRLTLPDFDRMLSSQGIYLVLRIAKDGRVFGMTFVDNHHKVVFNGSDLGKEFTAKRILDSLDNRQHILPVTANEKHNTDSDNAIPATAGVATELMHELMDPEQYLSAQQVPPVRRKRKKRKQQR